MGKVLFNNRVLGVLFIAMLVFAVWMINAVFTQKFVSFEKVKLNTDTIGLQLPARADVKVRGVIVGQVLDATTGPEGAELTLGIKPEEIDSIPSNVTASLLPKTLFGEKYVELEIPAAPSAQALKADDRITQTKLPVEVEDLLNDIYPLLRAIQPAELNYTLNALATAFEGRGEEIGQNLETLNTYLKRLNPQVPALVEDLVLLGEVSEIYADVMPQVAQTLRNSVKTGNTLVSKEKQLNSFLKDVRGLSNVTEAFLDRNGRNIIRLGKLSKPQLELLEQYSPTTKCLLRGIVKQAPMLGSTFRGFVFHIDLITLPDQPRPYGPQDRPVLGAKNPPTCAGLPSPGKSFGKNLPNLNDGVDNLGRGDGQRTATGFDMTGRLIAGPAGTRADKEFFSALTAPFLGVPVTEVPDIATLLFAPMAAGTQVGVR